MAIQLDNEQKQAVESIGSNILVSASAGAGKTGVLVQRLKKRVLVDKVRVSRILAMTFTEAAASEMKKRLASELHDAYENATNDEDKEYINSQLIELESADITTIDSYCLSLIKKYYSVIGLDPSTVTNILAQGSVNLYKQAAFDTCMKDLIQQHPDKALLLSEYFSPRSEDYSVLLDNINSINAHAQASINPNDWYEEAKKSYRPIQKFEDLPIEVQNAFFDRLLIKINMILAYTQDMKTYAEDDPKLEINVIEEKENILLNARNALNDHNYSMYSSSLENAFLTKTKANGKNVEYTNARKKQESEIKHLIEENYDMKLFIKDHNELNDLCVSLVELAENTWNQFVAYKQEKAVMDFTDMERYAYNILTVNNGSITSIIQGLYDEIMVDEFQDTSDLQNAIITMISNGHNVFRVGDVKQSIYRFRQAKPDLMRGLMNEESTKQITLKHNFRSKNSIVEFANHLFSKLMNVNGCKDSYRQEDTVSIGSDRQQEDVVPVEFALIQTDKDQEESTKDLKAKWIAQKILSTKQEDSSLDYKSFAILVRSHQDKRYLRKAFDAYNIPYEIDAREGFYQSDLCQTVLSFFRFMKDPSDSISLLSILTSSFYEFSDDSLAKLKLEHGSILDGIKIRYPEILEELNELKEITIHFGVLDFLKELSIRHNFYNQLNEAQKANFDFLFETVTNSKIDSYEDFLEVTEASIDEKSSEASSKGKDDDVVTVTTIHQSKGLQYPIVFLWSSLQNRFNDASDVAMIDDTFKIGFNHLTMPYREKRPTIQRMAVEYHSNLEDIEEFIRLLYVAITRAERRMFIVDATKKEVKTQPVDLTLLYQRQGMTPLILSAMQDDPYMVMAQIKEEDIQKAPIIPKTTVSELPRLTIQPALLKNIYTPSSREFKQLPDLDETSTLSGNRYGTMIHEIFSELPNTQWTKEDFSSYKELRDNDIERMMAFSKTDIYQQSLTMDIHKEFPFYIEQSDSRITGTMDFVAIGKDKIYLVDYKTDNASIEEIKKRYTPQLQTYIKALNIMYPNIPVEAYAYSLHHSQLIRI